MYIRTLGALGILLLWFGFSLNHCNSLSAQSLNHMLIKDAATINRIKQVQREEAKKAGQVEKSGGSLMLPFQDDFSYDLSSPTEDLWENATDIEINDRHSFFYITKGIATLDNFDVNGEYHPRITDPLYAHEPLDQLSSKGIDLSDYDVSDNINLSFYYQLHGNSYTTYTRWPGLIDARPQLRLEFYSCNSGTCEWVEVQRFLIWYEGEGEIPEEFAGITTLIPPPESVDDAQFDFEFFEITLNEAGYFHSDFKFRLTSYGRSGQYDGYRTDIWNLDYFLLDERSTSPIESPEVPDVGFQQFSSRLIGPYSIMPWEQFHNNEVLFIDDSPRVIARNLNDDIRSIFGADFEFKTESGEEVMTGNFGTIQNQNLNPGTELFEHPFDMTQANFPSEEIGAIQWNYLFNEGGSAYDILTNNEISGQIVFDDFLSYDDDSEEGPIMVLREKVALKFTVPDDVTLYGVQFVLSQREHSFVEEDFLIEVYEGTLNSVPIREIAVNHYPEYGSTVTIPLTRNISEDLYPTINGGTDFFLVVSAETSSSYYNEYSFILATDQSFDNSERTFYKRNEDGPSEWKTGPELYDSYLEVQDNVSRESFFGSYGLPYDITKFGFFYTPMIRGVTSFEQLEEELGDNFKIDIGLSKTVLCPGEEFYFDPRIKPSSLTCTDDLLVGLTGIFSTQPITYDYANLDFRLDSPFYTTAPEEPGVYELVLQASNSCGFGVATIQIEVLPTASYIEENLVCNNFPEAAPISIADNIYLGGKIISGEAACTGLPVVPTEGNSSFIAELEVVLSEGFSVSPGAQFLAQIGTSDYPCIEEKRGLVASTVNDEPVEIALAKAGEIINHSELLHTDRHLKVFPNPTLGAVSISYEIAEDIERSVKIRLHDVMGREVASLPAHLISGGGVYTQELSLCELPSGIYFCEISIDQEIYSRKIIKAN